MKQNAIESNLNSSYSNVMKYTGTESFQWDKMK